MGIYPHVSVTLKFIVCNKMVSMKFLVNGKEITPVSNTSTIDLYIIQKILIYYWSFSLMQWSENTKASTKKKDNAEPTNKTLTLTQIQSQ